MSKSSGDTITAVELLEVLPAEIVWFFILCYSPDKLLFFDQGPTLIKLFDEFAELVAKTNKTEDEKKLYELSTFGINQKTVSRIPFSHLVASFQAALRDPDKTIEVIARTEHAKTVEQDKEIIKYELKYIEKWLDSWAPEDVKFSLEQKIESLSNFTAVQKDFLSTLAEKVAQAPQDADGEYFHTA